MRNAQILGNSNLEKSDIYNVDLKWELYPMAGENVSVSVFGKNFIRPIEQIVADGSVPSNLLLTYTNPNQASVMGIEFEFRKKMNDWIDVYTNSALINSNVNVGQIKRQLQGQSNYIVNGGLNFHKNKNSVSITYNRIGERISAVGFQGYPDIKYLTYPFYAGGNRGRGQVYPTGEKSNVNVFGATQGGQITEITTSEKGDSTIVIVNSNGAKTSQIIPAGLDLLVKTGEIVKADQALNVDPNVGGFGQEESEIVLQDPARIVGYLAFCFCVLITQILLVLKKKQFEKVQAAELNF